MRHWKCTSSQVFIKNFHHRWTTDILGNLCTAAVLPLWQIVTLGVHYSIVAGQQLHKINIGINGIIGINGLHDRFKIYFVEHLCTIAVLLLLFCKNLWITSLKVAKFGKAVSLKPAALLKMNSYLDFYQGFFEVNILKRRIFGGLLLPLISRGGSN